MENAGFEEDVITINTEGVRLQGDLTVPPDARGVVLFAHGSGSNRRSERNRFVAEALHDAGLGTLLIDLLTPEEADTDRKTASVRFDVEKLARRVAGTVDWLAVHRLTEDLPVGLFGASTGAAAAIAAATERPGRVLAVVSRGGRPDLAGEQLARLQAPTLFLVGGRDHLIMDLNQEAFTQVHAEKQFEIVPGAGHLFEEAGALQRVAELSTDWFRKHVMPGTTGVVKAKPRPVFGSRSREPSLRVYRGPAERSTLIAEAAEPFDAVENAHLDALLERIGEAGVVLIGEASHGTSEFYRMRQRITRALIERKGFTIVGAEADWPDAEHVDEYVRGRAPRDERSWQAFDRFPSWMWRNHEVLAFVEWLRGYNDGLADPEQKAGFFGLDMYSLYTSISEVLHYLEKVDPELARSARQRYNCLLPFSEDPALYGSAVLSDRHRECEEEAVSILNDLVRRRLQRGAEEGQGLFDAERNAAVVASAEQYYRVMYYGSAESWNLRDTHMFETLKALLEHRDGGAKAVVWAHNSHIGNAAGTQMHARGEINIGHLCRKEFGGDAYLIGFGTHTGTVAAASDWGGPVEIKQVRPSHRQSYERLCHESGVRNFFLHLRDPDHPDLRHELTEPHLERAIGVIYRPETELQSHYFGAVLPEQFDEYVWLDHTDALRPLERTSAPALPERHPFNLLVD